MHLIDAELLRDMVGDLLNVAREHDGFLHARALEGGDGVARVGLYHVGDDDMAGILAVDRHVDDRADAVALLPLDTQLIHELAVARGHAVAVHGRDHAAAAALFNVRYAGAVKLAAAGLLQALADRV